MKKKRPQSEKQKKKEPSNQPNKMSSGVGIGPGRIDFLGGVADYSGSLVLQVATSVCTTATATLISSTDDLCEFLSEGFGNVVKVSLSHIRSACSTSPDAHKEINLNDVKNFLETEKTPFFARYMFGCVAAFTKETGWLPPAGSAIRITVTSTVPASQGVSSSASIEIATLRSIEALSGVSISSKLRCAHIAQSVENYVVGAPCGLMDQLASALGAPGSVLPIYCRPDDVRPILPMPESVVVVGWPSGIKHSVSGSPYLVARTATFMGKKIAEKLLGKTVKHVAELLPSEVYPVLDKVPEHFLGSDFLAQYGGVDDKLSVIEPDTLYSTRNSLKFPIEESFRGSIVLSLLQSLQGSVTAEYRTNALSQIGELMRQTHRGYTSIGLGCHETDIMLDRLAELGISKGIYGARMSGGGSGGTVVVLLERSALPLLEKLANELVFGDKFTGLIM
jgi:L-arabinokinase